MMRGVCRYRCIGCVFALCVACADNEARPSAVADCNDPGCIDVRRAAPASTGTVNVPGANAGTAGAGGSGGMPSPTPGTLAGSIQMLVESDLLTSRPLDGVVEIRTDAASGAPLRGRPEADGTFALSGVSVAPSLWVGVGTFDGVASAPFIDTLQVVDSSLADLVDLFVIRRTVMEEIAQIGFLSTPLELDPAGAHVILNFVDADEKPLSDVQVVFPEDVSVAYDAGDVYSDQTLATSTRGTAVLLNLAAVPYPGAITSIGVTFSGKPFSIELRLARAAVTLVKARLDSKP
jgi:hypothetical protein